MMACQVFESARLYAAQKHLQAWPDQHLPIIPSSSTLMEILIHGRAILHHVKAHDTHASLALALQPIPCSLSYFSFSHVA